MMSNNGYVGAGASELRNRMQQIRRELDEDVDQIVENAASLGDIRAYVRAHPVGWVLAAAVAGYLLVPGKSSLQRCKSVNGDKSGSQSPSKRCGSSGSIMSGAMRLAAMIGTRVAIHNMATAGLNLFAPENVSPSSTSVPRSAPPADHGNY